MQSQLPPLQLVKLETAADAASPEAQYLLSWVAAQARQVWPHVVVRRQPPGPPEAPLAVIEDGSDVLLLGTGNVLVMARSLAAMAARRAAGAPVVVPLPLQSVMHADDEPLYSLRGFERLEARGLAGREPSAGLAPLLPVSLLAAEAVRLYAPPSPAEPSSVAAERVGVFHQFVDYYGEVREDVLPFVPPNAREVLEVGCGSGATGRLLQERLGCRVTGVELNPAAAALAAQHLHRVVCGDVAEVALDGEYDAIVALELFEHLSDGEEVLRRLASHLRPGGRIVLSVPNVGHHSVVADLLAGRWDYLPIGLLCYTHYRFFTRRTLEDWMRRLGFDDVELVPQRTELPPSLATVAAHGGLEVDAESLATKGFYVLIGAAS